MIKLKPRIGTFDDLSEEARRVYEIARRDGNSLQGRSWRDEYLEGAKELAAKNWGLYQVSRWDNTDHHYLWITRYAKGYTHVKGRHALNIQLSLIQRPVGDAIDITRSDSLLRYADLEGADITEGRANWNGKTFEIAVREPSGGTDFEHDSMYVARFAVSGVQFLRFEQDGTSVFAGQITEEESFFLGFGEDPFGKEGSEGEEGEWCESAACQGKHAHRFGPYLPRPARNLKGQFVLLEVATNHEILKQLINDSEDDD